MFFLYPFTDDVLGRRTQRIVYLSKLFNTVAIENIIGGLRLSINKMPSSKSSTSSSTRQPPTAADSRRFHRLFVKSAAGALLLWVLVPIVLSLEHYITDAVRRFRGGSSSADEAHVSVWKMELDQEKRSKSKSETALKMRVDCNCNTPCDKDNCYHSDCDYDDDRV